MSQKTKAYLRLAAMAADAILMIVVVITGKSLWTRIPAALLAAGLSWLVFRSIQAIRRKKSVIYGKVLSLVKPKNKYGFGKTIVVVKAGKVSKKLYTWQKLPLRIGSDYGFYYEEKSNQIISYEVLKASMVARPKGNLPPQYR